MAAGAGPPHDGVAGAAAAAGEHEDSLALLRAQLVYRVSDTLDRDGDGRLSAVNARPFADFTSFEGTEAEWAAEFGIVCRAGPEGAGAPLMTREVFVRLVDDTSDEGC